MKKPMEIHGLLDSVLRQFMRLKLPVFDAAYNNLNVDIPSAQCIRLNEVPARLDIIAH